jgi:hypothetical protein
MTRPLGPIPAKRGADLIIGEMADHLFENGIDLGDESRVILALNEARFRHGDVLTHMDAAIARARAKSQAINNSRGLHDAVA